MLDKVGLPNIGVAIILFTIIVNVFMLPLTYKQQKFSKLSMKMQPELKAIQKKYEGKKDQNSVMAMNQETQGVYAKYGVSPTGSCLYLLIQMPILFALYRVIYAIPAYVNKIGNVFHILAQKIIETDSAAYLQSSELNSVKSALAMYSKNISQNLENGVVDVLNRLSTSDLHAIADHYDLGELTYDGNLIISKLASDGSMIQKGLIDTYNSFLGLSISNQPWDIMKDSFENGSYAVMILAILIPVLSGFTQWLSVKLAPQANQNSGTGDAQADSMAQSMKTMNVMMPAFSVWIGFTLPAGLGIYWIANAVVRIIIQIVMNKKIDAIDFDELIAKNKVKSKKKLEKLQQAQERMNAYANVNTKSIQSKAAYKNPVSNVDDSSTSSASSSKSTASAGTSGSGNGGSGRSMLDKANMVKEFNERNNKK